MYKWSETLLPSPVSGRFVNLSSQECEMFLLDSVTTIYMFKNVNLLLIRYT